MLTFGLLACGEDSTREAGETSGTDVYRVSLPPGWEEGKDELLPELNSEVSDEVSDQLDYRVQIEASSFWIRVGDGGFKTNVNVSEEGLPPGLTFQGYKRLSVANAPKLGITLLDKPRAAELDGEPAFRLAASRTEGDTPLRFEAISSLRRGIVYTVTLTALPDRFAEARDEFVRILESWRWLPD
jgi:hypothetical protein